MSATTAPSTPAPDANPDAAAATPATAYLLAIALGPVQEFIAAGRKTRDLWYGSFLLGEVSRQVAKEVQRQGGTLIFPDKWAVQAELPVANKVLARVDAGINPRQLVREARAAAQAQLETCRVQALTALQPNPNLFIDPTLFKLQLDGFLEFAAAWYPLPDPKEYDAARREVELLLAGRKALRDFGPAAGGDGVSKSSLDAARESVIRPALNETQRRRLRLKGAEQLDGVSLIKRLAEPRRFVSIARVAIDPFIRRAERERRAALADMAEQARALAVADHPSVESFRNHMGAGLERYKHFPYDTQLFWDDGANDRELSCLERDEARAFHQAAEALRRDLDILALPTYFAVLVADGDYMGKAISKIDDFVAHQTLSARLACFAAKADAVVQAHHGAMVYSGGDDVLAFLPLDRALACAGKLQLTFKETMEGATGETRVSLSVGVAIGHYGEHLQRLLDWGRAAERAAKSPRDPRRPSETARNALAVSLHARGAGEGRTVVHSWLPNPVTDRWDRWVEWLRCDAIPDRAAYELNRLEEELRPLWPDPADVSADAEERRQTLGDLQRREVGRVLGRRRTAGGAAEMDKDRRGALVELVGSDPAALRRLADELLIARRLAAATDAAEGRIDPARCAPRKKEESPDGAA